MITKHTPRILPFVTMIVAVALVALMSAPVAGATPVASKFVFSGQFGWEVNATTGGDVCTVASKDTCQPGKESEEPGGFSFPRGVAVDSHPASPEYNDVYVADKNNHRVQVFSPTGAFVSMFGEEVNETTKGNVCTEAEIKASDVKCKAGVEGSAAGQFGERGPESVAIDPASGNVYVTDGVDYRNSDGAFTGFGWRVQELTAEGKFVLEIGKEVNETTKGNLCTQEEVEKGAKCKGPEEQLLNTPYEWGGEHGAFNNANGYGNLLAVGGPEDLLYVGDEHRVQEFRADGEWKGEISLASISSEPEWAVEALAVDETGDVYLAYGPDGGRNVVREFTPAGVQSAQFEVAAPVKALAIDPYGRLGVIEGSGGGASGVLYSASGVKISEFAPPSGSIAENAKGLAFSASDELYVVGGENQGYVEAYAPALFPEAVTCPATEVTGTTAVLCGEINANGLQTRGFFDYSPPTGGVTPVAFEGSGVAFEPFSWSLTGLEPNETYGYKVVAEAEVAGEPVKGTGEPLSFHTATPPPEVPGVPSASDVTNAFALLSASVNPEHALARYHFEYGPCVVLAGCVGVVSTAGQESSVYGSAGAIQEAVGLQPATAYSYRLVADNRHEESGHVLQGGETVGAEGQFTTAPAPVPVAETGGASGVGTTSATISGTVNPDGQAAVYTFELGVYDGVGTRYGIVLSGAAGDSSTPVAESLPLSGLQPGTTYAYRIAVKSGYGEALGATMTFTTEGLPAVLSVPSSLPMLAVPKIAFPAETTGSTTTKKTVPKCKKPKKLAHGACVKVKAKKRAKKAKKSSRSRQHNRKSQRRN